MSEQITESVNRTECGWVIEGGWSDIDKPDYWVGSSAWSQDSLQALRFARRQDAQQAAERTDGSVSAERSGRMNTSKGRAQSARKPRHNDWPSAADFAEGLVAHDFVGPTRTFMYVHCRNCELIFKPAQGRGPCPGPKQPLQGSEK